MLVLYADIKNKNVDIDRLISLCDISRLHTYRMSKHPDDAKLLASALLKDGLRRYGIEYSPDIVIKNQYGKEYLKQGGIYYSISHTDGFACVCISEHECGIDCERVYAGERHLGIAKRFFTSEEYRIVSQAVDSRKMFSRLWTKKESYVKLLGVGFAKPMSGFNLPSDDGETNGVYQKTVEVYGAYVTCSCREDFEMKLTDKTHEYITRSNSEVL